MRVFVRGDGGGVTLLRKKDKLFTKVYSWSEKIAILFETLYIIYKKKLNHRGKTFVNYQILSLHLRV